MSPGPFEEVELFATFEQTGKRNLLDLYNVSFFCGAHDEQGKPIGDIGLDDLIDSQSPRTQKMQEDTIWIGTATIKEKDRIYQHLNRTLRVAHIGLQREAGFEIRIKGKYYLHGFGEPDSNFRFVISLTQQNKNGQRDGRHYRLLTLTPDCMRRSLRAIHQASVMAFMRKAETRMGSRTLEWYEMEYKKAFPRSKDPSADEGKEDEGKPVHRREFYSAIAMHLDDLTFCKDIVRKRILSRQTIEEFKMKRKRIMNLPRDERQGWGSWSPLSAGEVARSWKLDRNHEFPRLRRPKKQQRTEPGPSHLRPMEQHPRQVIEIFDSDDDEKDSMDAMGLIMAVPASSLNTRRIPTPPALHSAVIQPIIQMPICAPASTLLSSIRPPRRISDNPRRRRSLPSSSRKGSKPIPPVYERSPSPLGGSATYRSQDHKAIGNTRERRKQLSKMAQDGMFKQDFMDDNYVWICPVKTCRHIFRMKEPESWTEEVRRNVTSRERRFMETQTWRYGNEDAKQIIEKNIMRPHYEMHAAGYGFKFESDKSRLVDH